MNDEDIKKEIKEKAEIRKFEEKAALNYPVINNYLCRYKTIKTRDGKKTYEDEKPIPLINATIQIIEENVIDDGKDSQNLFLIEGKLYDKFPLKRIEVPAEKFSGMTWLLSEWGSKVRIELVWQNRTVT